ncbi:MAG: flippase-like domain-containing protein [Gammaproteobacteria bacterium]|nr:flippase-like domain-containing protein [Gammaproteobacteria bacterium]
MSESTESAPPEKKSNPLFRIGTWLIAIGCFYMVYRKIEQAALREDLGVLDYLLRFFGEADWVAWLALMIPYSLFFFVVDAHVTWRVIRWFNAPQIKLGNVLPIRASAYILSLVNEQVGKGAMSLYLYRRYQVPALAAISSMLLLGLMEIFQLLLFSSVGVFYGFEVVRAASSALPLDVILPAVFGGACVYLPLHIAYFRGYLLKSSTVRDKSVVHAFRHARPVHYLLIVLFKAPLLIGAIVVYTLALDLFNVDVSFVQMLAFLPVIFLAAALPLPFHAGALLLWTVLFPDYPEVGAFSFVMHTFFVLFNALIGVVFLPKANKELFGGDKPGPGTVEHRNDGGGDQQPG